MDWIDLAQDRDISPAVVNEMLKLKDFHKIRGISWLAEHLLAVEWVLSSKESVGLLDLLSSYAYQHLCVCVCVCVCERENGSTLYAEWWKITRNFKLVGE